MGIKDQQLAVFFIYDANKKYIYKHRSHIDSFGHHSYLWCHNASARDTETVFDVMFTTLKLC